jgi:hypothetical protein
MPSDERMGVSFTVAAGPCQCSHSWVQVTWDSWPRFTVSDSRLPQSGRSGLCSCIPQEQGGPVIPPGTGFPFCHLLWLAGLRWEVFEPTSTWGSPQLPSQSHIAADGQSVSKSYGAHDQIFITVWQLGSCFCGTPSLTRGRVVSFVYAAGSCQHSLSWVQVPWNSGPYFTVSDLRLPFSLSPMTHRVTVEVFDPTSTGVCLLWLTGSQWRYSTPPPQEFSTASCQLTQYKHFTQTE